MKKFMSISLSLAFVFLFQVASFAQYNAKGTKPSVRKDSGELFDFISNAKDAKVLIGLLLPAVQAAKVQGGAKAGADAMRDLERMANHVLSLGQNMTPQQYQAAVRELDRIIGVIIIIFQNEVKNRPPSETEYYLYKLKDVIVTSYTTGGSDARGGNGWKVLKVLAGMK